MYSLIVALCVCGGIQSALSSSNSAEIFPLRAMIAWKPVPVAPGSYHPAPPGEEAVDDTPHCDCVPLTGPG